MSIRPVAGGTAVLAVTAALLLPTGSAQAAPDTTGPTLTAVARFVVGTQADQWDASGEGDPGGLYVRLTQQVAWSAADPSGICGFDLARTYPGADPTDVLVDTTAMTYTGTITDYDGTFGGGSVTQDGWLVTAHDCAGNTSQVSLFSRPAVYQEDGSSISPLRIVPTLKYTGAWATSHCACALGLAQRKTSVKGAKVKITARYDQGSYVGLVMAKGPQRGKAKIFLDGKLATTIDTYATSNTNRVVTYSKWLAAGKHTVKVVNVATKGRPRIDLDAVLVTANPALLP